MQFYNFFAVIGFLSFIALAFILSTNRKSIDRRSVIIGLALHIGLGALFVFLPILSRVLVQASFSFQALAKFTILGAGYLLGAGEFAPGALENDDARIVAYAPMFTVLPRLIFYGALSAILYRLGFTKWIVGLFQRLTGRFRVSGAAAIVMFSNLFFGIESLLFIHKHLKKMSGSDLCAIVAVGMSAFASNFMAWRILKMPEEITKQLLSASLISLPAAFAIAKMLVPATAGAGLDVLPEDSDSTEQTFFETVLNGGQIGLRVLGWVFVSVVAITGMLAVADLFLALVGGWVNSRFLLELDISVKGILGLVLYPVGLLLGAHPSDSFVISRTLGLRVAGGEFAAIRNIIIAFDNNTLIQPRTATVSLFTVGGFANLTSFAVYLAIFYALMKDRIKELAPICARALLAAVLASLMTGALVRILTLGFPVPV
jgi:concentrative nucleoside transporter, CNT family